MIIKKVIDLTILLFCVVVFVTCSKEESISNIQNIETEAALDESIYSQEFADLNAQLQVFNQEFMDGQPASLRGWRETLVVVSADILGAGTGAVAGGKFGGAVGTLAGGPGGTVMGGAIGGVVGGVICGAAASVVAASKTPNCTVTESVFSLFNEDICLLPLYPELSVVDSIGYFHNKIIEDLFRQYPNIGQESQDFIFQQVVNKMKAYGFKISDNVISALKEESKAINQIIISSPNDLFGQFRVRYPETIESINVIERYVNNLSKLSTNEQVLNYTTGFGEIVTSSSIPASSVSLIQGSITVGMNSNVLWIAK